MNANFNILDQCLHRDPTTYLSISFGYLLELGDWREAHKRTMAAMAADSRVFLYYGTLVQV